MTVTVAHVTGDAGAVSGTANTFVETSGVGATGEMIADVVIQCTRCDQVMRTREPAASEVRRGNSGTAGPTAMATNTDV